MPTSISVAQTEHQVDTTLDTSIDTAASGQRWWWERVAIALLIPLVCFVVLRPESYGLTPNRLDPFFYTGYAINFDDIMREIGGNHYFVTRWTAYLPSRFASELLGPVFGRLVLRWVVAAGILLGLWHLGRRWKWTRSTEIVVGVVVLTAPMFARAFLTDYVEWALVAGGLALIPQCLAGRRTFARSAFIGTLSAALVIVNPFAVMVCGPPVFAYLWLASRPAKRVIVDASTLVTSAVAVVLAGLVVFRWRYGIDDVYAPTIDFVGARSSSRDPWKSPRLSWMFSYSWIYIPAIALAIGWLPRTMRHRLLANQGAVATSLLLTTQYVTQWLDQFVRDSAAIEVSYYWVLIYPSLAVFTALLIGSFAWRWQQALLFIVIWFALLVQAHVFDVKLPGGWVFVALLIGATAGLLAVAMRRPAWSVAALMAFALVLQVNAPTYDPSSYYGINSDPLYDSIYFNPRSDAVIALDEAVWLESRLDTLPNDAGLFFVPGDFADAIIGIYGPHVTGHVLTHEPDGSPSVLAKRAISGGSVDRVAVYGPPAFVESVLAELSPRTRGILLQDHHNGGFGFDLTVLELWTAATGPFVWAPVDLLSQTGSIDDRTRNASPPADPAGFVVFGPYIPLGDRAYQVSVEYRSEELIGRDAGFFDVSRHQVSDGQLVGLGAVVAGPITGTGGEVASLTLDFVGSSTELWEFRVWWDGEQPITIERIRLDPLD